ncbi:MAG: DUF3793 family protein [Ruminococcus sp.]|nr:DUF3793 family protein [Ruminococcus sp.]
MLESKIIEHCAPTLAGLKAANLFTYKFASWQEFKKELQEQNDVLNPKDVYIEIVKPKTNSALLYVYRKKRLEENLSLKEVQKILHSFGYQHFDTDRCIRVLKQRLSTSEDFPHEIGLFLDYPLQDVCGFIEHKGKNYKFSGIWKVYGDVDFVKTLFDAFQKCKEQYCQEFSLGKSIMQLTVAA